MDKHASVCPSCGHCPTCGHGGYRVYPNYPIYPQPYWQRPYISYNLNQANQSHTNTKTEVQT